MDETSASLNRQVGGDHYQGTKIQPIEVILDWHLDFTLGNVIKYIFRLGRKGGNEKIREYIDKAIHYLEIYRDHIGVLWTRIESIASSVLTQGTTPGSPRMMSSAIDAFTRRGKSFK
jgi:uncharacterized protein DUF3310